MLSRILIVLILVIPVLVLLPLFISGCLWVLDRLLQRRFQYSLRMLLIVVTAVAMIFSAFTAWDRWTKAQLEFLDADASDFAFVKKPPAITEDTDSQGFEVVYRPRYRTMGELHEIGEKMPMQGGGGSNTDFMKQITVLNAGVRSELENELAAIVKADVLLPGRFVIHGLLKDTDGNSIPDAQIDLKSPNSFNLMFKTLEDGTFFIPIKPPVDSSYSMEIYYGGKRMESTTFSLDPARREMFIVVRVR